VKSYKTEHFYQGEKVYHLKNEKLIMVVFGLDKISNTLFCGWIEKNDNVIVHQFKPEELRKERDLNLMTRVF
jgi:hypothetical protein